MNLPNTLTIGRIVLVPLLVVILITEFSGPRILGFPKELVAAVIFAIASITDWLDGYLARRRKQVTTLGQLMDPVADKLLITAALVSLVQMELTPAWMAAAIIGRELLVTGLRGIASNRGVVIAASSLGKWKMGWQVAAVLFLLVGRAGVPLFVLIGQVAMWIVLGIALWSAADYYRRFSFVMSPKVTDISAARERAQTPERRTGTR
jgi:CDP-diacylglycerol--glycerol-3-phosphate 3-phosphatidyltransferase